MSLRLVTDATTEPLTLAEARLALNWDPDDTSRDARITRWIVAARKDAETRTRGRILTTQVWDLWLDRFPCSEIELGAPDVIQIDWVKYLDAAAGVQQTLDPSAYVLDRHSRPGWLLPAAATSWPDTYEGSVNTVQVRFTTGFLADADKERALLQTWMEARIQYYERGVDGEWSEHLDRMLDGYVDWSGC